jgi:hypothetical protein
VIRPHPRTRDAAVIAMLAQPPTRSIMILVVDGVVSYAHTDDGDALRTH